MKMEIKLSGEVNGHEADDIKVEFLRSAVQIEVYDYGDEDNGYNGRFVKVQIRKDDWAQIARLIS